MRKRDQQIAILRGQWQIPHDSAPYGALRASYLLCNAIARSGRYKQIDLFEEEVYATDKPPTWQGVLSNIYEVNQLRVKTNEYSVLYLSKDIMHYISHSLRPANDWTPAIIEVGTSHYIHQWINLFHAALAGFLRPTDGLIFKSTRTQQLFQQVWHEWNKKFESLQFPLSRVILNGIDIIENQRTEEIRNNTRDSLGITPDDVVFLTFSRLAPTTKLDYSSLIALWKEIVEQNPRAILLLSGSIVTTPDYSSFPHELLTLARQAGIANRVIVLGNPYTLWANAKNALMSAADAFLHTTKGIEETSSLTVLEAMAHELPVVASDWSGLGEVVSHGIDGWLVKTWASVIPDHLKESFGGRNSSHYNGEIERYVACDPKDIICYVLAIANDKDLRINMGKMARQKIELQHQIDYVAKLRISFFDEVSTTAETEWQKSNHIPVMYPLVNMELVPHTLASHHLLPNYKFQLVYKHAISSIPETNIVFFEEITMTIVESLELEGITSGEELLKHIILIYKDRLSTFKPEEVWSYVSLILTRLLSYHIIEIISE